MDTERQRVGYEGYSRESIMEMEEIDGKRSGKRVEKMAKGRRVQGEADKGVTGRK